VSHHDIRIGTLAPPAQGGIEYLRQVICHGFESFQLNFWKRIPEGFRLDRYAGQVRALFEDIPPDRRPVVSSLGIYGNPLEDKDNARDWARCIDACAGFGCDLVTGFAGRVVNQPIPDSFKAYKRVFGPLARRAADKGVRLAFENCNMGGDWQRGDWNIAHAPTAWQMMFNELPDENVGLEWEPCHQLVSLVDPMAQLRQWAPTGRIFHIHGKDATVAWDVIRTHGIRGGVPYVWHRTPGFGDTNWTDVISILRQNGYKGAIDIEGWHDPVYRGDLEMTGQVHALNHLRQCRGGAFVANPAV
jgi:sugar phosphate isomerase/epimerase